MYHVYLKFFQKYFLIFLVVSREPLRQIVHCSTKLHLFLCFISLWENLTWPILRFCCQIGGLVICKMVVSTSSAFPFVYIYFPFRGRVRTRRTEKVVCFSHNDTQAVASGKYTKSNFWQSSIVCVVIVLSNTSISA